jgi:ABC-type multidrug transport system ATPase subunit
MKISLHDISYRYKGSNRNALERVSLEIDTAQPMAIVGKNGSGKSTLLKILVGQYVNYTGAYAIDGASQVNYDGDLLSNYQWGYLPEEVELDDRLTGYETTMVVGELRGLTEETLNKEIERLKERLGIEGWFETKQCKAYSQGMRKKLGLVFAFLGHRNLVILDEPTNYLDVLTVLELKKLIREKINEGMGIIISSHIIDFISTLVDRTVVLNDGSVQYDGKLSSLHESHPDASFENIIIELLSKPNPAKPDKIP